MEVLKTKLKHLYPRKELPAIVVGDLAAETCGYSLALRAFAFF